MNFTYMPSLTPSHPTENAALGEWFCPLLNRIAQDIRGFDGATLVFRCVVPITRQPYATTRNAELNRHDKIRLSIRITSDKIEGRTDTAVIVSEIVSRLLYVFRNVIQDRTDILEGSVGIVLVRDKQRDDYVSWEQFSENLPDINGCALRNQDIFPIEEVQTVQQNARSLAEVVAMFTSDDEHMILLGALDIAIKDISSRHRTLTWRADHAPDVDSRERAKLALVDLSDTGPYLSAKLTGLRQSLGDNVPPVDLYTFAKRTFRHA